jgi:hypothetical protein
MHSNGVLTLNLVAGGTSSTGAVRGGCRARMLLRLAHFGVLVAQGARY